MTDFGYLLHAEWTKFRTVRGWVAGLLIAIAVTVGLGFLQGSSSAAQGGDGGPAAGSPSFPRGPGGEAVDDSFFFVHQPVTGNGTITVRMTSLTGQYLSGVQGNRPVMTHGSLPWSKAGIILKASLSQGSAYAAMLVTGSHGVRMQWNYVNDTAGLPGPVSATSPRWLRLVRAGGTITGYDSADGVRWIKVGTVVLPGLGATVQAGMFATSPYLHRTIQPAIGSSSGIEGPSLATGTFDHVTTSWPAGNWSAANLGGNQRYNPGFRHSAGTFRVSGSGDIAPVTPNDPGFTGIQVTVGGAFAGLIAIIVVAALFITAEYRRGMIRVSLSAFPRRGGVLAAKTVLIGTVSFGAGLVAAAIALVAGGNRLKASIAPVSGLTEVRLALGVAALLAVAAVLALALGTIIRRSAIAVATVIVIIFIPILLATVENLLPRSVADWLLRLTPAAGFAVEQAYPAYHQVTASYTVVRGYYPLAPWAGLAVECAWALAALALASYLLRRRDA